MPAPSCRCRNLPKARRPISLRCCARSRNSRHATASRISAFRSAMRGGRSVCRSGPTRRSHDACRNEWAVGEFYKLRAKVQQTNFGPQLEIRRIRAIDEGDAKDGFDPLMCLPRRGSIPSRCSPSSSPSPRSRSRTSRCGGWCSTSSSRTGGAAHAAGGAEESPCLGRRIPGTRAQRDADLRPSGREVRRAVSRSGAADRQRPGDRRRHAARHRQAARAEGHHRQGPSIRQLAN